jgi:hypothetical protein
LRRTNIREEPISERQDVDSEDPDETLLDNNTVTAQKPGNIEEEEDEYEESEQEYDPRLEQKIQKIKNIYEQTSAAAT